jgi:hypothetical protein
MRELSFGLGTFLLLSACLALVFAALLPNTSPESVARNASLVVAVVLGLTGALLLGVGHGLGVSAPRGSRILSVRARAVVAAVMLAPTVVAFGPSGAFHHMIGFGLPPFVYMVLDGEGRETSRLLPGYGIHVHAGHGLLLLSLWTAVYGAVLQLARWVAVKRMARRTVS